MTVQTLWTQTHIKHAWEKTTGPGQAADLNRSVCERACVQEGRVVLV